jgi:protein-tyrosine phosphatase
MPPLVDLHCHLLAGLDDGPRTWEDSLAMCRIAAAEGVCATAALAHQNERWAVAPEEIRTATGELARRLDQAGVPLAVYPAAEVMAAPDLPEAWAAGRLLSVGDHGRYLLVEMPHRIYVDLGPTARGLRELGPRLILAHPERHPELLHDAGRLEGLIRAGCLVQVSAGSVTNPTDGDTARALRDWFRRGCVHFLGSDGHSPRTRRPLLAAAATRVREWAGPAAAERVCGLNALAVLRGERLRVEPPRAVRRWWPACLLG